MKHTKKFMAAVMAVTMVSALAPVSIFATAAEETKITNGTDGKPTPATGSMLATYDVEAKYTVTIPTGVELDANAEVTKDITADAGVILESGKKVVVKLTKGSNTETGSTFHAKKDTSIAEYTISVGGTTVGTGGTVATFSTNKTEAQKSTLTFSKPTGWTAAGEHTETLTFTISVE